MATINLPNDLNGITEVGVAAGTDNFSDTAFALRIIFRATADAPRALSNSEIQALRLVTDFNATDDVAAKTTLFNAPATNLNLGGMTIEEVLAHIDNWPNAADEVTAGLSLTANAVNNVRNIRNNWEAIDPQVRGNCEPDVRATLMKNSEPNGLTNQMARKTWQTLVAYMVSNGWFVRHQVASNGLLSYHGPEENIPNVRTATEINELGFHPTQESANMIVALKLTWWLINHHVGQIEGQIDGFAGKVAAVHGYYQPATPNPAQINQVRNVLWFIGKMCTTRGILDALEIGGIIYANASNTGKPEDNDFAYNDNITIGRSDDVDLRVNANPAGTASIFTHFAIAKRAAWSQYGVAVPPLTSLNWNQEYHNCKGADDIEAAVGNVVDDENRARGGRARQSAAARDARIQALVAQITRYGGFTGAIVDSMMEVDNDPARHHMGSHFLTGQPRRIATDWQEEEMDNLSAFIHATSSGSTLAKAPVIKPQREVASNSVYTTIVQIRAAVSRSMTNRSLMQLMSRVGGGAMGGGMALQFGRITSDDVQQVIQGTENEEAGDGAGGAVVRAAGAAGGRGGAAGRGGGGGRARR